jgi:predicted ABC-type ATPase
MRPRMIVVAGPPGSGKSSMLSPRSRGVDAFNADDRAAFLNGGSYHAISTQIRETVNREFEEFIMRHISDGVSFAFETTLRTQVTLEQARLARVRGFVTRMDYIALDAVERNIDRISIRGRAGGHSAPPSLIRAIRAASLSNLASALREFDLVRVYDNSEIGRQPRMVLRCRFGKIASRVAKLPGWLEPAVKSLTPP